MKILIVDDKKEGRYLLETMLKGNGFDVVATTNGAEALEKLRANGFDMIVSDILMPVMDGFALCRECKGDEKLKDIPFVFYTATYTDEGDEEFALKLGAHKFIRKPTDPEEFIKIIQGVIGDAEEGKLGQQKPLVEEEKEVFKLYNERLINKLEKKMLDLESEITERKRAEEELEKHREHLEELVRERTAELTKPNQHLRQQIEERKEAEDALKKNTAELRKTVNLMAGREVRMAELKETIQKLRAQMESAGLTPVADDPLKEMSEG